MEIAAVDQGDLRRDAFESFGGFKPAEAASNNDYPMLVRYFRLRRRLVFPYNALGR